MDIFDNLKNNIYDIINNIKKDIRNKENKRGEVISKINTIDKFLKIAENSSELYEPKNLVFCFDNLIPLLLSEARNYTNYLYETNADKNRLKKLMKNLKFLGDIDSKLITITTEMKEYLEYEKKKNNVDDLKIKRNEVKNILSNIENKNYKTDINIINEITEFMKSNTNLENDEIDNITSYMIDEYNKKLELEKQRQMKKEEVIEPVVVAKTIIEPKEEIEKIEYNIMSDEDKELIEEVNNVVFLSKNKLKSLNDEYIKVLEENMELFEDDEYKSDIILYKLNIVLSKIFRIQDILNSKNKISETSLNRYINFKDKLINKLENLYMKYLDINKKEETKVDNKDKKALIYLTNKNDKLYFDIDKIDKENYPAILKMLEELEDGYISSSKVKDCIYQYSAKLKGLFRKRRNSSRIIYIPYNEYMFILTMYIKNTNYTKHINEYLEHVADDTKDEIKRLKRNLQDPKRKDEIIINNQMVHDNILETINNKIKSNKQKKLK